mgnify:FL=1
MAPQLSVFIASSLDGYIATVDDKLDWLMSAGAEGEDYGFEAFMASVDAIGMGRGTYNFIENMDPLPYRGQPLFVFTHRPPPERDGVTFWQPTPREAVDEWTRLGLKRVYVDGGNLISSFLAEGLIDDLLLTKVPILLGDGKRLFNPISRVTDLVLQDVQSFPSGMVNLRYQRK